MVAIIVDALRAVPRRGSRAPPRSASTAGAGRGRSGCAPRARRSSPPPCSPPPARSARRSCSRWSRARSASPQPARRPHVLPRADPAARRDDRRQRRGPLGRAVRADDLRLRRGPARLEHVPLVRGLGRQAAPAQVRGDAPDAVYGHRRCRRGGAVRAPRAPRRGGRPTGSGSRAAGPPASADARSARDLRVHALQGLQYLRPSCSSPTRRPTSTSRRPAASSTRSSGRSC